MRKRLITFRRVVRTGLLNFVRNAQLAIAAIAVMSVTLTIILFSIVANATFSHTISQINDKINVSVYLNDKVTEGQRTRLMNQLRELPNVRGVSFVSKEDALKKYRSDNSSNQSLLQAISETGNPLPSSITIDPIDPAKIQGITDFLNKPDNKTLQDPQAGTSYSGERKLAIDNITHATGVLRKIGVAAVILFAFISVLIIFNTIQMAIFNRRDELTIMRLLGATTWYIRGPFVVESVVHGVIAALVSIALIQGMFVTASSALQASSLGLLDIAYSSKYFQGHFWTLLGLQLLIGVGIGAGSSIIATRRYLKFKTSK
jgi:cell division transport system permease protein